ncbi:hypothetical protein BOSE62_50290 [Bosea sp. 62]|nr:hypothetical protein BOSE21B_100262 [Bosea sp. 21B]CAD5284799.1 hypothetical protein BOSE7B_41269 [Bosea sp. 7B]CAD5301647.1 hypothetical protein BOSE46_90628 [Bosea sp. 46]VVT57768.1 hypothetical protein BOS5A_200262 [Bosea sp. EC-HK365B]VXB30882.1 hypothetical protein BOSE29B_100070 [Bosea sp. 29B]VXB74692.1 hypothetical protein BOSE125_150069 [Bosea sp. 125]VXC63358.1 hypothetical protein BOSE62_50290 [Bosea sp. 62]VXC92108.1 hypothetical protein BOSE127_80052 [Bosea sp. 127]
MLTHGLCTRERRNSTVRIKEPVRLRRRFATDRSDEFLRVVAIFLTGWGPVMVGFVPIIHAFRGRGLCSRRGCSPQGRA